MTPEQAAEAAEAEELVGDALRAGVLAEARLLPAAAAELAPAPHVLAQSQRDVVRRSAARKGRYLVLLCGQLAPVAAGRVGSLARLDSRNPVLYLDFPAGRLKLLGTLVFPRARYLVLAPGPRQQVVCEDVFENVVGEWGAQDPRPPAPGAPDPRPAAPGPRGPRPAPRAPRPLAQSSRAPSGWGGGRTTRRRTPCRCRGGSGTRSTPPRSSRPGPGSRGRPPRGAPRAGRAGRRW